MINNLIIFCKITPRIYRSTCYAHLLYSVPLENAQISLSWNKNVPPK